MGHDEIERGPGWKFDFTKLLKIAQNISPENPVVPVIVQNMATGEVLILAYINELALQHSLETGIATFWSTSRNELWVKGKTSGDTLRLEEVRVNCDQNSLLFMVTPEKGGACHVKDVRGNTQKSCYYRHLHYDAAKKAISLKELQDVEL